MAFLGVREGCVKRGFAIEGEMGGSFIWWIYIPRWIIRLNLVQTCQGSILSPRGNDDVVCAIYSSTKRGLAIVTADLLTRFQSSVDKNRSMRSTVVGIRFIE